MYLESQVNYKLTQQSIILFPILGVSKSTKAFKTKEIESKNWEGGARIALDDTLSSKNASKSPDLKNHSTRKRTRIMIMTPSEAITTVHMKQKTTGDANTESDLKAHMNRKRTRRIIETSTKADKTTGTNLQTSQDEIKTDEGISDGRTRSVRKRTRTRIETSKEADMATHTKQPKSEDENSMHVTEGKSNKKGFR